MTTRTFRQNNNIPIPNCYKWAENYFGITFNDVINVPSSIAYGLSEEQRNKNGIQKSIKKGDFLHYKAIFIKRVKSDRNSKTFNNKKDLETYILNNNNDKAKVK